MSTRTALYCRVSTGDQDLDAQERALRAYADSRGWSIVLTFKEAASGSGSQPRPEFKRLREATERREVKTVLIVKLDRIARTVREALAFFDEAEAKGVRVVVTTRDIDTGPPAGRLTRTILAGVDEFEGERIRERTRAAMAAIRAGTKQTRTGRRPGRPRRVTSEAVERASGLWWMNRSWAEIAQATGLKAETIRRAVWAARRASPGVGNTRSGETAAPSGGDGAGG